MDYRFDEAVPASAHAGTLRALLLELCRRLIRATRTDTWSPFDRRRHLIHGERTGWVPRIRAHAPAGDAVPFPPFDREAMLAASGTSRSASCSIPSTG